ncbi:hypothetical protein D3C85_1466910 [compost metagenome]
MDTGVITQAIGKAVVFNASCPTADTTSGKQLHVDQLPMNLAEQNIELQLALQIGGVVDYEMRHRKSSGIAQADQETRTSTVLLSR